MLLAPEGLWLCGVALRPLGFSGAVLVGGLGWGRVGLQGQTLPGWAPRSGLASLLQTPSLCGEPTWPGVSDGRSKEGTGSLLGHRSPRPAPSVLRHSRQAGPLSGGCCWELGVSLRAGAPPRESSMPTVLGAPHHHDVKCRSWAEPPPHRGPRR